MTIKFGYTVAEITRHTTLNMLKKVYDCATVSATRELIDGKPEETGTKTVQTKKKKPGRVRASRSNSA